MVHQIDKIKWDSEKESYLIDLVEPQRCLWDIKDKSFHKQNIKRDLYSLISTQLKSRWPEELEELTCDDVMKRFAQIRTYYHKKKRQVLEAESLLEPDSQKCQKESLSQVDNHDGFMPCGDHFEKCSFLDEETETVADLDNSLFDEDSLLEDSGNSNEVVNSYKRRIELDDEEQMESSTQPIIVTRKKRSRGVVDVAEKMLSAATEALKGLSKSKQTVDEAFIDYLLALLRIEPDLKKRCKLQKDIILLVQERLNI